MLSVRARICRWVWSWVTARVGAYSTPQEMQRSLGRQLRRPILPRGVTLQKTTVGGVRAEWLIPAGAAPGAVLLYIHGGAWTMGWYEPHRWLVSHLARATARRALALDYRLAPAHPFPAALDDCLAACRWLLAKGTQPEEMIIAGDSAGGNLTLATMLALRDKGEPLPAAAVCLSPVTDLAGPGQPQQPIHDAGLPIAWAQQQRRFYLGDADPHLPLVSPYYAGLHGLPPLLVQVGGDEYLLADAQRFVPRARAAGVDVTLQVWPGMWHVWQILVGFMPEANRAVAAVAAFCRQHQL
jgi:monoterpene epsilon-lactone hydrolase